MTQPGTVDVVVVGGGHKGLVAAAYLARAGLSVTVLEALGAPGGMTRTEYPIAAAPQHSVDPCAVDVVFMHASKCAESVTTDHPDRHRPAGNGEEPGTGETPAHDRPDEFKSNRCSDASSVAVGGPLPAGQGHYQPARRSAPVDR